MLLVKLENVFCGPGEPPWQRTKESVDVCDEEERNTEVLVRSVISLNEGAKTSWYEPVMRRALELVVECQRKKRRLKRT